MTLRWMTYNIKTRQTASGEVAHQTADVLNLGGDNESTSLRGKLCVHQTATTPVYIGHTWGSAERINGYGKGTISQQTEDVEHTTVSMSNTGVRDFHRKMEHGLVAQGVESATNGRICSADQRACRQTNQMKGVDKEVTNRRARAPRCQTSSREAQTIAQSCTFSRHH